MQRFFYLITLLWTFLSLRDESLYAAKKQSDLIVYTSPTDKKPWSINSGAYPLVTFGTAVYGRMLHISRGYEITPGIISSWKWNYKTDSLELVVDSNARFHNGREVLSTDIEFNLIRPFITTTKLVMEKWISQIEGTEDLKQGMVYKSGMVKGITIKDRKTLELHLKVKDPTFIYALGKAVLSIYPREELLEDQLTFRNIPIGAGPYKVIWSDPKSTSVQIELIDKQKFDSAPRIVELVSGEDAYKNADLVMGRAIKEGETKNSLEIVPGDSVIGSVVLDFNFSLDAGKNHLFRKAIKNSLNRNQIANNSINLIPQYELIPAGLWGHAKIKEQFDLESAKKLVLSLPDNIRNKTHILGWNGASKNKVLEIKRQLEQSGLKFDLKKTTEYKISEENKDFTIFVYGAMASFLDPLNMFSLYLPTGARPLQHPEHNTDFEKLYQEAQNTKHLDEKISKIAKISQFVNDQIYTVPILTIKNTHSFNSKKIESLGDQGRDIGIDLTKVRMKK